MTTSQTAVLSGVQEPRYRPSARKRSAHVDDCVFLANAYGLTPDPWQTTVLECWLATEKDGRMRAGRCGLAVPRQNGKNAILEMVELHKMVVMGRRVLHTAHEVKTARKAFVRLRGFFENERQWPELARLVKEIRSTNGQEAVILHAAHCPASKSGEKGDCLGKDCAGGSCEFIARSRGSGRGYTVDDLVCDEAQELTDEQLEALLPTISSAPSGDPQQIYTGTPPPPGSPGTVFRRMRDVGITRKDPRMAWVEWSVSEVGDVFDRHRVAATNPALGIRLQMSVVDDELGQMTPEGYARERLGWWAENSVVLPVISDKRWRELRTSDSPTGAPTYGVRFNYEGTRVALAVAAVDGDVVQHVEVIEERATDDGVGWLKDWLTERWRDCSGIVVDGKSGAGELVAALIKGGVSKRRVISPTPAQFITAHAQFLESVKAGTLSHFDQAELNAAVKSAGKRVIDKVGGGWGWQAIAGGNVLPLEAATLAAWWARQSAKPSASPDTHSKAYVGGMKWR